MDKIRERGAPLPGNDNENWGNHDIDVLGKRRGFHFQTLLLRKKSFYPPWRKPNAKCVYLIKSS